MATDENNDALPTMPVGEKSEAATAVPAEAILPAEVAKEIREIGDLVAYIADWIETEVLTLSTGVQLAMIVTAIVLGVAVAAIFRPAVTKWLAPENLDGFKARTLVVLQGILTPLFSVLFLWLAKALNAILGLQSQVIDIAISLTIAWIVIRLISNLIANVYWSRIMATVIWTVAALIILGIFDQVRIFLDALAIHFGDARISVYMVIKGGIVAAVLLWTALAGSRLLHRRIERLPHLTPSVQVLISQTIRFFLIVIAVAIALNTVGIDLTAFAVFSGAVGVGVGFGLQKIVSNVMSGIILLLDSSVKPGDVIEVVGTYGEVRNLGARYTAVKTRDGTEHLIPNEELIANTVINWSHTDRLIRIKAPVGVSYGADIELARQLIIDVCNAIPRVLNDPPANCLVKGFGDSSVDLEARFWVADPEGGVSNVRSQVFLGIWHKFKEHGIEIPFPQRDLHIRSGTTPGAED